MGTIGFVRDLRDRWREKEAREELATELKAARDRYQYLLTVTPGVIYTTKGSGYYACTSVSEKWTRLWDFRHGRWLKSQGSGFHVFIQTMRRGSWMRCSP